jgi:HD superfamily phosphodiesterase
MTVESVEESGVTSSGVTLDVEDLLQEAEEFVKEKFKNHDPSHDWYHVQRVRLMALNLSRGFSSEGSAIDKVLLELAALFHDLCDAKYVSASSGPVSASSVLAPFMDRYLEAGVVSKEMVAKLYRIVDSVSWSKEEARLERTKRSDGVPSTLDRQQAEWESSCPEFMCVSDADRLDAIGSIGESAFYHTFSLARNSNCFRQQAYCEWQHIVRSKIEHCTSLLPMQQMTLFLQLSKGKDTTTVP